MGEWFNKLWLKYILKGKWHNAKSVSARMKFLALSEKLAPNTKEVKANE